MHLLILGGTDFVGPAIAADALSRGWQVTVFHRGRHDPPPGVSALHGDRTTDEGRAALRKGEWDAAVDTWYGPPSTVRDVARPLTGRVGRYVYVSTRAVYAMPVTAGADEDEPVVDASPDDGEVDHARAKRGGELAALDAFGDRALLPRPGIILGPRENVGRLMWWLSRIARSGDVPAPGPADMSLQYIDVRDLATWTLDAVERGLSGPYNTASEYGHATMGRLLTTCVEATGNKARLRWIDPEDIAAVGVTPDAELPIWLPPGAYHEAIFRGDVTRAYETGLRCRPVEETVRDTWHWMLSPEGQRTPFPNYRPIGLDPAKEERLLRR